MRALLVSALVLMSFTTKDQLADGKVLIEFNASFNKSNSYEALGRINGAKLYRIDIEAKPALKEKYNIKSVPTIIYFSDGDEKYRWSAGIDMKLHVHFTEIQEVISRY